MENKEVILKILGEGGSITLSKQGSYFFFGADEGTLLDMLDEEDRVGLKGINKSKTYSNFEDAFEGMLNKYPVFKLYPSEVSPEYEKGIKKQYLKFRLKQGDNKYNFQIEWEKMLKI